MKYILCFILLINCFFTCRCMNADVLDGKMSTNKVGLSNVIPSNDFEVISKNFLVSSPIIIYAIYLKSRETRLLSVVAQENRSVVKADLYMIIPFIRDIGIGYFYSKVLEMFSSEKNKKIGFFPTIISCSKSLTKWHEKIIKQEARYNVNNSILNDVKFVLNACSSRLQSILCSPRRLWNRLFRRTTPPIAFP